MGNSPSELIARAVLYEGYILYPYRASAIKNRHRWTFGGLAPRSVAEASGEPYSLRTEFLVTGERAEVSATVRFLQPVARNAPGGWQEAVEREVHLPVVPVGERTTSGWVPFTFLTPPSSAECTQEDVCGTAVMTIEAVAQGTFRIAVRVLNLSPCDARAGQDEVALRTFLSAHVAFRVQGGEFVSLTDPPEEFRSLAAECRNEGVWPVLVGTPGDRGEMLASPIILPDYPQIAPESGGDFFDGTEIDEMLALRVLTLTDAEKREMAATDPRARAILERVESLPQERMRVLHGANRAAARAPRPGDRVRLAPRGRADAFDVLLAGKLATVASVEVDFEGLTYFAVTVDDDPGGDLGAAGQVGHRFFFRPDEVELLAGAEP